MEAKRKRSQEIIRLIEAYDHYRGVVLHKLVCMSARKRLCNRGTYSEVYITSDGSLYRPDQAFRVIFDHETSSKFYVYVNPRMDEDEQKETYHKLKKIRNKWFFCYETIAELDLH